MNEDTTPAVTDWIPGHIKPVRVGVYERQTNVGRWSYWSGEFWATADNVSPSGAMNPGWIGIPSGVQDAPWRGLASDPAKPAAPAKPKRQWMRWALLSGNDLSVFVASVGRDKAKKAARSCGARAVLVRVTEA
jgi:hypothetical protein